MFGIHYLKAAPTTYVLVHRAGGLRKSGAGLSFFYYAPTTTLATVPLNSADIPFVFTETTNDFQTITVQGQLTYRVTEPQKLAALLDYTLGQDGKFHSDDPQKLPERVINTTQILSQAVVGRLSLRQALAASEELVSKVLAGLRESEAVAMLGVEILSFSVISLKPTPEMARALEAEAREELSRRADGAIYDRRNAAVEQERRIKESELNTEIAVEEKKRTIRETQMSAEIAVELQRASLLDQRVANDRKDADSRAYSLRATLEPLEKVDWKTLLAMSNGGTDPKLMIALAFRELAENATKIGEMNISPDLLQSLTRK